MTTDNQEIGYLDSFSADTSVVPKVIDKLIEDLNRIHYKQFEIDEIVLSMMKRSPTPYRKH